MIAFNVDGRSFTATNCIHSPLCAVIFHHMEMTISASAHNNKDTSSEFVMSSCCRRPEGPQKIFFF
jgi:hypothetical protein